MEGFTFVERLAKGIQGLKNSLLVDLIHYFGLLYVCMYNGTLLAGGRYFML